MVGKVQRFAELSAFILIPLRALILLKRPKFLGRQLIMLGEMQIEPNGIRFVFTQVAKCSSFARALIARDGIQSD